MSALVKGATVVLRDTHGTETGRAKLVRRIRQSSPPPGGLERWQVEVTDSPQTSLMPTAATGPSYTYAYVHPDDVRPTQEAGKP